MGEVTANQSQEAGASAQAAPVQDVRMVARRAKTEHGAENVKVLTISGQTLVFKKPGYPAVKRYFEKMTSHGIFDAAAALIADTLLHPSKEEAGKLFEKLPGMTVPLGTKLQEWAGAGEVQELENF